MAQQVLCTGSNIVRQFSITRQLNQKSSGMDYSPGALMWHGHAKPSKY
jgi:hypothetical protein